MVVHDYDSTTALNNQLKIPLAHNKSMILSGEQIKQKNLIETLSDIQFQPAGVDLSLKEVHKFISPGKIDFGNKERKLSETQKLTFENGELFLPKGVYKIVYNEYVKIPKDCLAFFLTRSSLLRCGAHVVSAVWDPGYEGRGESLLCVENELGITFKENARVVQLVFIKLENEAKDGYAGVYHGENR